MKKYTSRLNTNRYTKTLGKLGELTGESYKDELLDEIFSKFCLGK